MTRALDGPDPPEVPPPEAPADPAPAAPGRRRRGPRGRPFALLPDESLHAWMTRAGRGLLREVLRACGPALREADAVHKARVATRRLDGMLRALRGAAAKDVLRGHRRTLSALRRAMGAVRDLDVLGDRVAALVPAGHEADVEALRRALRRRRGGACTAARRRLRETEDSGAVAALRAFVRSGGGLPRRRFLGGDRAQRLLDRAAREVERRLARARAKSTPVRLHALRVSLKHLRYRSELLGLVAAGPIADRKRLKTLRRLQDLLGTVQDMANLRDGLAEDPPLGAAAALPLREILDAAAEDRAAEAAEDALDLLASTAEPPPPP